MKFKTTINKIEIWMEFVLKSNNLELISNDNNKIDFIKLNTNTYSMLLNNKSYFISVNKQYNQYEINVNHTPYLVEVKDKYDSLLETIGMSKKNTSKLGEIKALIPGHVTKLFAKKGDRVIPGQKLIILEAMKMENEIASPINGVIKSIYVKSGDKIDKGSIIMEISKNE